MSATVDFYLARATENALAAKETDLANVRERCLRSEAVWRALADRLIHIEEKKQRDALEKVSRAAVEKNNVISWPVAPYKHRSKPLG